MASKIQAQPLQAFSGFDQFPGDTSSLFGGSQQGGPPPKASRAGSTPQKPHVAAFNGFHANGDSTDFLSSLQVATPARLSASSKPFVVATQISSQSGSWDEPFEPPIESETQRPKAHDTHTPPPLTPNTPQFDVPPETNGQSRGAAGRRRVAMIDMGPTSSTPATPPAPTKEPIIAKEPPMPSPSTLSKPSPSVVGDLFGASSSADFLSSLAAPPPRTAPVAESTKQVASVEPTPKPPQVIATKATPQKLTAKPLSGVFDSELSAGQDFLSSLTSATPVKHQSALPTPVSKATSQPAQPVEHINSTVSPFDPSSLFGPSVTSTSASPRSVVATQTVNPLPEQPPKKVLQEQMPVAPAQEVSPPPPVDEPTSHFVAAPAPSPATATPPRQRRKGVEPPMPVKAQVVQPTQPAPSQIESVSVIPPIQPLQVILPNLSLSPSGPTSMVDPPQRRRHKERSLANSGTGDRAPPKEPPAPVVASREPPPPIATTPPDNTHLPTTPMNSSPFIAAPPLRSSTEAATTRSRGKEPPMPVSQPNNNFNNIPPTVDKIATPSVLPTLSPIQPFVLPPISAPATREPRQKRKSEAPPNEPPVPAVPLNTYTPQGPTLLSGPQPFVAGANPEPVKPPVQVTQVPSSIGIHKEPPMPTHVNPYLQPPVQNPVLSESQLHFAETQARRDNAQADILKNVADKASSISQKLASFATDLWNENSKPKPNSYDAYVAETNGYGANYSQYQQPQPILSVQPMGVHSTPAPISSGSFGVPPQPQPFATMAAPVLPPQPMGAISAPESMTAPPKRRHHKERALKNSGSSGTPGKTASVEPPVLAPVSAQPPFLNSIAPVQVLPPPSPVQTTAPLVGALLAVTERPTTSQAKGVPTVPMPLPQPQPTPVESPTAAPTPVLSPVIAPPPLRGESKAESPAPSFGVVSMTAPAKRRRHKEREAASTGAQSQTSSEPPLPGILPPAAMAIEAIEAEPLPGVGPARDHGHLPVPVPLAEGDAPLPRPEVWLKLAHSKVDSIAIEPTPSSLPSDPSMIDTPTRRRHQKQKSISLTGSQDLSSSLELVQTPAPADVNLTSSTSFELDDVDLSADSPSQAPLNGQPTKRAQLKDMAISLVKGLWGAKKEEVEPEQATPPPPRQPEPVVTAPPTLAAVIPVEAPAPLRSSAVAENSAFSLWALSEQQQREQATRSPVEPPKQSSHVAVAAVVAETSPLPTTSELIARPTTPSSSSSASSADLSKFRAQIDALRTERDEYAMKQSDLEHSQKLMRSENASMQLTLRNMQTSASDAMQRVALLEGENNELKRDKQMLQALVEDLKSALALQQQQNKRVAETPDKKSPASTDRASQLVKAQYEERVRSLQARTEELSASNLTLNDKNEDLKIELEETRDKLSRIETQARNERRELTGKVGELAATNAALEAKLRAYGQTVAGSEDAQQALESQKKMTVQLAGQNVLLEAKIRTLEARLVQATRERDSMATELVEGKLNSEKSVEDAIAFRAQVERLELSAAHHDQVVEELRKQVAAEKDRFEVQQQLSQKQTALLENLMEENAKLVSGLDFYRKVGIDSKKHGVVEALHKDKNTLLQSLTELGTEYEDLKEENDQLRAEVAALVKGQKQQANGSPVAVVKATKKKSPPPPSTAKPKKVSSEGKKKSAAASRLPPPSPQASSTKPSSEDNADEENEGGQKQGGWFSWF